MTAETSRYQIVEKIAEGGMATVYRAHDKHLGREVALKVLPAWGVESPGRLGRFLREVRMLTQLHHPHIVEILDFGESGRFIYFAMELAEGGSLGARLNRGERLMPAESVKLARQVGSALATLHKAGMVHRDVKPANILLTREGDFKLGDFGLGKAAHHEELTGAGELIGTVRYLPPEGLDRAGLTTASDIFQYGLVLYEASTGHRPFRGQGLMEIALSFARDTPTPPSHHEPLLGPAFDALVERCLARDPAARFPDGVALMAELDLVALAGEDAPPGRKAEGGGGEGAGIVAAGKRKLEESGDATTPLGLAASASRISSPGPVPQSSGPAAARVPSDAGQFAGISELSASSAAVGASSPASASTGGSSAGRRRAVRPAAAGAARASAGGPAAASSMAASFTGSSNAAGSAQASSTTPFLPPAASDAQALGRGTVGPGQAADTDAQGAWAAEDASWASSSAAAGVGDAAVGGRPRAAAAGRRQRPLVATVRPRSGLPPGVLVGGCVALGVLVALLGLRLLGAVGPVGGAQGELHVLDVEGRAGERQVRLRFRTEPPALAMATCRRAGESVLVERSDTEPRADHTFLFSDLDPDAEYTLSASVGGASVATRTVRTATLSVTVTAAGWMARDGLLAYQASLPVQPVVSLESRGERVDCPVQGPAAASARLMIAGLEPLVPRGMILWAANALGERASADVCALAGARAEQLAQAITALDVDRLVLEASRLSHEGPAGRVAARAVLEPAPLVAAMASFASVSGFYFSDPGVPLPDRLRVYRLVRRLTAADQVLDLESAGVGFNAGRLLPEQLAQVRPAPAISAGGADDQVVAPLDEKVRLIVRGLTPGAELLTGAQAPGRATELACTLILPSGAARRAELMVLEGRVCPLEMVEVSIGKRGALIFMGPPSPGARATAQDVRLAHRLPPGLVEDGDNEVVIRLLAAPGAARTTLPPAILTRIALPLGPPVSVDSQKPAVAFAPKDSGS